jgi:hypothetical protein
MPPLDSLQDPCFTEVEGRIILGGVRFPVRMNDGSTGWRMEFYRLAPQQVPEYLFSGPDKMKDIRLKQLPDGSIAVFTRPRGLVGGRGRIGFTVVQNLAEVTPHAMEAASLLSPQHPADEWSGANEIHLLQSGMLGVLGHLARFDRNNDGQIDMEEWEEARRAAQAEAAKIGQSAAVAPSVDLLSKPKESGRPFILSAVTEEKLRRKQTLIAFVSLVIAFCCGVGLAFSLLSRLR